MLAGVKEAGLSGCPGTVCWAWASLTCMEEEGWGRAEGSLVGGKQTREGPCRTSAGSFSVWDVNSERLAAG